MHFVVYLALLAIGFYFGKWLGAIGLVGLYFFFLHYPGLARQAANTRQPPSVSDVPVWAFQLLHITPDADKAAIEKARKKRLNQYHPDKLGQVSATEKQAAEEKIHQIHQAYQAIKTYKGF